MIEGTLDLRDGCVVLGEPGNEESWRPVIWPVGTSIVSSDPLVIGFPTGAELAFGEQVAGGGYSDPDRLEVDIPESCSTKDAQVAVFNAAEGLSTS